MKSKDLRGCETAEVKLIVSFSCLRNLVHTGGVGHGRRKCSTCHNKTVVQQFWTVTNTGAVITSLCAVYSILNHLKTICQEIGPLMLYSSVREEQLGQSQALRLSRSSCSRPYQLTDKQTLTLLIHLVSPKFIFMYLFIMSSINIFLN